MFPKIPLDQSVEIGPRLGADYVTGPIFGDRRMVPISFEVGYPILGHATLDRTMLKCPRLLSGK